MPSIKTYALRLAELLGSTPSAIYERQRDLVRAGQLTATTGRGPGSGVAATPDAVAMVVLSVLCSDGPAGSGAKAAGYWTLRCFVDRCPITGQSTLGAALGSLISRPKIASTVRRIMVCRTHPSAEMLGGRRSIFGDAEAVGAISVTACVEPAMLAQIGRDLARCGAGDHA